MIGSLYKALGLTTSASIEEIKKAYRQLAKEYHPDKNKDGAEKFKEISHAYSILIDPEKKREYISKTTTQSENFRGQRGFSAHEFTAHGFAGFSGFEHFFHTSAFERDPSPPKKTPEDYDIRTTCKVTLEEIYNGLPVRVNYKENRECLTCHGNPKQSTLKRSEKCKHCDGKGRIDRVVNQKATASSRCHFCKGQGYKSFYASCKECQNEPLVNKKVGVRVPKGVHDGHSLQLRNRGNLFPDKKTRGALLIRIQEEPHLIFTRQGDHLYINVKLTLKEAVMGFKNKVICTHLDGRMLTATQPTGQVIKPGSKRLIKGEGMPIFNSQTGVCGDLLVTFQVEFPDTVRVPSTREARLAIDALFETEEEIQARENAIVIDDEDETKESGAIKEDNNIPPITIPDDDNVMKEALGAESNAASIPEDDQEHYIISDGEEAQQSAHENSNQEDSDEFFSDEDDFPHLFNVFL